MKRAPSRRAVLRGAAAAFALAAAPACRRRAAEQDNPREAPGPRALADDLRHLILLVGPWILTAQAESLLSRYLSEERLERLAPDRASYARLAARFADHAPAAESIDLAALSAPERAALVALTADLYSLSEVRFLVAGAPELGRCLADPRWHTHPPEE